MARKEAAEGEVTELERAERHQAAILALWHGFANSTDWQLKARIWNLVVLAGKRVAKLQGIPVRDGSK